MKSTVADTKKRRVIKWSDRMFESKEKAYQICASSFDRWKMPYRFVQFLPTENIEELIFQVEKMPYPLAASYSLDEEKAILKAISIRNIKVHQPFNRSDLDAISEDWKRVGESMHAGIRKVQGTC